MCGFIFACSSGAPISRERFNAARDRIAHRGPDAAASAFRREDRVALGHRRLSIVDLYESGNQPMQLGSLWVVFNGEIYNYAELRHELEARGCTFRGHCDTEVLLHGYRVWGRELCSKLEGMFAFALWDEATGETYLGRDHFGQKPLHFAQHGGVFVAASEIKAVTALLGHVFPMRRTAPVEFLVYDYVPEPFTWYDGIDCLEAGHHAVVRESGGAFTVDSSAYWTFRPDPDPRPISQEAALELIGAEVDAAVKSHLMADVEVGAFLSGGVDSGAVVTLAAPKLAYSVQTFSIGYNLPGQDELPRAREVARSVGATHRERTVTPEDFAAGLARAVAIHDQPFGDTSFVPTGEVARLAAQHVKVVLTGDGGDEVFGGYWHLARQMKFPKFDWSDWTKIKWSLDVRRRGLAWWQGCNNFGHMRYTNAQALDFVGPDLARELKDFDALWHFRKHWDLALDPFRRAQWLDLKAYLTSDVLVKVDRATMQHSLEARPPFLRHRLVEKMMNLPTAVKNPDGEFKGLFRKWLRGKIPDSVLDAPKLGFGLPKGSWENPTRENFAEHQLRACRGCGVLAESAVARVSEKSDVLLRFCMMEQAFAAGCFAG